MNTATTTSPDLDEQASADWINFPPNPQDGVLYGGGSRTFESAANAVRYVIEKLPAHQRASATIRTDSGRNLSIDEIERAYKSL